MAPFFYREDYSFTAYATISYLKVGPRASLLSSDTHAVTMQVRKSTQSGARVTLHFQCALSLWAAFLKVSTRFGWTQMLSVFFLGFDFGQISSGGL